MIISTNYKFEMDLLNVSNERDLELDSEHEDTMLSHHTYSIQLWAVGKRHYWLSPSNGCFFLFLIRRINKKLKVKQDESRPMVVYTGATIDAWKTGWCSTIVTLQPYITVNYYYLYFHSRLLLSLNSCCMVR